MVRGNIQNSFFMVNDLIFFSLSKLEVRTGFAKNALATFLVFFLQLLIAFSSLALFSLK
jgi:hypothetical protein